MSDQNVLIIGGSRHIGYHSGVKLLDLGAHVTFLLRSPSVFDKDEVIQKYIKSGQAKLIKGDCLVKDDVKRAWDEAAAGGAVNIVIFSVGGTPKFNLTKGFVIDPPNLVTQCLLNVLCTIPESAPQPKIITLSSIGLSRSSHAALPFYIKPFYGWLLDGPHKDKLGAERAVAYSAGWEWDAKDAGEPGEDMMGPRDWKKREGLPAPGTLKRVLVVRPALLTDGACVAEKLAAKPKGKKGAGYRVSESELSGVTISRKDVAHFVVDAALNRWDEFEHKVVNIAY